MDLESLGNLGDFISGLSVVASLLYLARQINQNTASVRQSVLGLHMQANIEANKLMVADASVANLFHEGIQDREALSDSDRRRFDAFINIVFRTYQHSYELKSAIFEDRTSQIVAGASFLLSAPGVQSWWAQYRTTFSPQFAAFVDQLLTEMIPSARSET